MYSYNISFTGAVDSGKSTLISVLKNKLDTTEKNNLKKVDKTVLSTTKLLSNFSIKNLKITSVIILKKTI